MSYTVEYNPDVRFKYPRVIKNNKTKIATRTLLATVLLAVGFVIIKTKAYEWLIPGDPDVTVPAFSGLISDFTSGMPVKEAVVKFCRGIVTGVS